MPITPSSTEVLLIWIQTVVSLAFPIAITVILWMTWRDWHRWVDYQLDRGEQQNKLDAEIEEFID